MSPSAFISHCQKLLGQAYVLLDDQDKAPYLSDWRNRYQGKALAILLPNTTARVAEIVKVCNQAKISIVPQGGNTSMCGAATPNDSGQQVVMNLKRMQAIRGIDASNQTIVVEAGCILQTVQEAAKAQGFLFPLSLGAQGSCQIGGNLATNAGGTNVLRYGNARELCLGLEVVTAQGEVMQGLRSLRKDNTGFDLRDLYIGSEGCLGIITAAVFKLYPLPTAQWTALVAVPDIPSTIQLLNLFQKRTAALLTGFEMMSKDSLDLTAKHFPQMKNPLSNDPAYTVLVELSDHESEEHARNLMESVLESAFESGLATDAVIASNLSQAQSFWTMREHITMAQAQEGANLKHDISLPISSLHTFIEETDGILRQRFSGVRLINFGHLGDGNLHYNVAPPVGTNPKEFNSSHEQVIHDVVYTQVEKHHGSISAEHGIGQLKLPDLEAHRGSVALQLMRSLKHALDPNNILNPGKVISQ